MIVTGVLHMHSTHSYDGKVPLSDLKQFLMARGVQVACMTEHTDTLDEESAAAFVRECRALSDDTFIFVPGFEVPYKNAHVLHIGTDVFTSQVADAATLQTWRAHTPFVVLAHPVRNQFLVDETLLACLDGVEIWNQQYEGKATPRPRSAQLLRDLRVTKGRLLATGGLDLHRQEHFGAPLTKLTISEFSEAAIVSALQKGAYAIENETRSIAATDTGQPSLRERLLSAWAVSIIVTGKGINKWLAALGLSLPKSLKQLIRARV